MKIAVMHSNLRKPFDEALRIAADLGIEGIHLNCGGDLDARQCDRARRREVLAAIRAHGLEVSAICSWGGQVDLGDAEKHHESVPWGKANLEMSVDLEAPIWMGHVGVMPRDEGDPRWQAFVDAAGELAQHGEQVGACLAMETGPEPPRVMRRLIETVGSPGLRVNYDPANLILWPAILVDRGKLPGPYDKAAAIADYQPVEGVRTLGQYIVHTHAKDALVHEGGKRQEVPLGQGWVDWPHYLGLLRQVGFDGWLAIERETGEDPTGDVRRAVEFLRQQIAALD